MVPCAVLFNIAYEALLIFLRNNNQSTVYLIINLIRSVLEIGVAIILILWFQQQWEGRITGILIGGFVTLVFFLWYVISKGYLRAKFEFPYIRSELMFALPGFIVQCTVFIFNYGDKFVVAHQYGQENLADYSVAWTFASIIYVFCSAFIQYLQPRIYETLGSSGYHWKHLKLYFKKYIIVIFLLNISIMIGTWIAFKYLITKEYQLAIELFYILSIGTFLWTLTSFFQPLLLYSKNTRLIYLVNLVSIAMCVLVYLFCLYFNSILYFAVTVSCIHGILLLINIIGCNKAGLAFVSN